MRVQVIAVGRLKAGPERDLAERYLARSVALGRQLGLSGPDILELPEGRERRTEGRQASEAGAIRDRAGSARLWVLDERAASPTSETFAGRLATGRDAGWPSLALVIGGPDGLERALVEGAEWSLSFGRMTLPHQLVRALALEQIYRAFTLMAGHPYHRAGAGDG